MFFEGSVFYFSSLIVQKLKSKHTSLKKYTNWEKLIHFSLVLREREEQKTQIFWTIVTHFPASNPNPMPNYNNSTNSSASLSNGQMIEKRRVSIVNTNGSSLNGNSLSGKHSLSSNINIITSPDRHILPGVYK